MTRKILLAGFLVSLSGVSFAGAHSGADVGADVAKAESCILCHESSGLILKNSGVDTIVNQIKTIGAGGTGHPPVLQGASDADIAEIAKILNERG